jgi:hypothetical protein
MPDIRAAVRHPSFSTSNPTIGAKATPPNPVPIEATDIAKARLLRNHWFNAAAVELLYPVRNPIDKRPTNTKRKKR